MKRSPINPGAGFKQRVTELRPGDKPLTRTSMQRGDSGLTRSDLDRNFNPGRGERGETPRPKRAPGVRSDIRAKVYARDEQSCVRCGKQLEAGNRQLQHRVPRGMGGRKDHDRPSALILLCGTSATDPAGCHHHVESHRFDAQAGGWLVPFGSDPLEVPVRYADGVRYYLDDECGRVAA